MAASPDVGRLVGELFAQTQRASGVLASTILDELLERCLLRFFHEGRKAKDLLFDGHRPLRTFGSKLHAAYLLGIINSDARADLETIRRIRNDFAHKFEAQTFQSGELKVLCDQLSPVRCLL